MSIKKSLKKIFSDPTEMKLDEVINVLKHFGYNLTRIRGSHHIFSKVNYDILVISSHQKKVKRVYLKIIKERIQNLIFQEL